MQIAESELRDAALRALPHWGYDAVAVELLSLSENAVYDVTLADDRHVALRIHRPGYNTLEEMRSEVVWVAALASAGVRVPSAIPSKRGEHYVAVKLGDGERYVGVIDWVTGASVGDPLGSGGPPELVHYERIGEVAAAIRAHHTTWAPPAGFVRRHWNAEGLVGDEPIWGRFWDLPELSNEQRTVFEAVRERLFVELSALSTAPDRYGLIHADLHLGNIMADGDITTVIDFDDSGFGWFSFELAVALHSVITDPILPAARRAMISGYRSVHPLDDDEVRLIDTFLTVRSLMIVAWLSNRPEVPAYAHLDEVVAEAYVVAQTYLQTGRHS